MMDDIDSFAAMFPGPPGEDRRVAREVRARKERRTQLREKQRRRKAVRTTQLNFRCSPEFKERTARLARRLEMCIADAMEAAIAELEDAVARLEMLKLISTATLTACNRAVGWSGRRGAISR